MNSRNRKILEAIFEEPIRADITWDDVESLVKALGGRVKEGRGSRVRLNFGDVSATFHAPHGSDKTDKGALKSVRRFLEAAGVKP
jgi:hypothetical protein